MKIDYKKEVDSGIDRKVSIERITQDLLRAGMPLDVITGSKNFNIRHREMINNLQRSYDAKISQLQDMGIKYEELGDSYHYVVHNLQELYPLTEEEEKEIFKKMRDLKGTLNKDGTKKLRDFNKKKDLLISKILVLKTKNPVLDSIISMLSELDGYLSDGTMTPDKVDELFNKYGLKKEKYTMYNVLYNKYKDLVDEIDELTRDIDRIENGTYFDEEREKVNDQIKAIEEEIIKRNIKLVNYFIREYYGSLLVEQEELFNVCLNAMANSVREFDSSYGYKFSTFAIKGMDIAVKANFKELTGLSWSNYWARNKIRVMLDVVSRHLRRKAKIEDLYELGLLDMPIQYARAYSALPEVYLESCLYEEELRRSYTTFDDYEAYDKYEDDLYENNFVDEEEAIQPAFDSVLKDQIASVLQTLTDRDRIVIALSFGLDREGVFTPEEIEFFKEYPIRPMTCEEIGKVLHLSRGRVHQILNAALRRLRHPSRSRQFRGILH